MIESIILVSRCGLLKGTKIAQGNDYGNLTRCLIDAYKRKEWRAKKFDVKMVAHHASVRQNQSLRF